MLEAGICSGRRDGAVANELAAVIVVIDLIVANELAAVIVVKDLA
jgi:hypothetical protein